MGNPGQGFSDAKAQSGYSLAGANATVRATIKVGEAAMALSDSVAGLVDRVVVDTHAHLPDMFEITMLDPTGTIVDDANMNIGTPVQVWGGPADSSTAVKLIDGEVTAIEARCSNFVVLVVVRGYEKAHRLQRVRRSRTFVDMTDSDVARKIAGDAGLDVGTIDDTNTVHTHLGQIAQTDWEFLKQRARENGFETGVTQGKFFFRRPAGLPQAGGAGAPSDDVDIELGDEPFLIFRQDLIEFFPRVTAGNLTTEVEVRVWDPKAAEVVVGKADSDSITAWLDDDPASLADKFGGGFLGVSAPSQPKPDLPNMGPAPSDKAFIVVNRPSGWGSSTSNSVDEMAIGVAEHLASTFAEAEGLAVGNPKITPGTTVDIYGVPDVFSGGWMVTNAQHMFEDARGGYLTRFFVSGRHDRSLLGMTSSSHAQDTRRTIDGLVMGIVTNNNDDDTLGRVKVALPWLSPDFETDWARVVQVGVGKEYGAVFVPDVGDEVLVGFEFGDVRRPYVLGGLINGNCQHPFLQDAIKTSGYTSTVVKSGWVSRQGHVLLFDDDGGATGSNSAITLGTKDNKIGLKVDQTNGKLTLNCDPSAPESQSPQGTITIQAGNMGTIEIKTGSGGQITIDGGSQLSIKAQTSISIESQGTLELKGQMIKLN